MPGSRPADLQKVTIFRRVLTALAALLVLALFGSAGAPAALADATIVVNSTADPGPGGTCEPGGATTCTLREALDLVADGETAGVSGVVTIEVEAVGQIVVGPTGALVVDPGAGVGAISITGAGAGALTVDGNEQSRVFRLADGDLSISGLTITRGTTAGGGAGILAEGDSVLTLEGVHLSGNDASGPGGGLFLDTTGTAAIVDSEFVDNTSAENGGGLHTVGPATIERTTFAGNSASLAEDWTESGGGLSATGTTVLLRNSTVTGNQGGGASNVGGELTIRNSTLAGNDAYGVAGTLIVMQSSILAGNNGGGESPCLGAEVQSQGNNLVEAAFGDLDCTWNQGSGDAFGANPQLGSLGLYGGPTQTLPPVSMDSPAINHGENPQSTDQRGAPRPIPAGVANTDVGAVEVQAPLLEVADPPSISPDSNLVAGETLTCAPGTWDTDTVTDADFSFAWVSGVEPLGSGDTYVLSEDDAEKPIACTVTVDNGVTTNSASSPAVELDAAVAGLAPNTLNFGSRRVGTGPSVAQTLTVTNGGGTDLEIDDVTTSNPEFPVDASDCTAAPVGPGESCAIEVRFSPAAVGAQSSFVTVKSNGGEPVATANGTATEPAFSVAPTSHDFGNQRIETTSGPKAFVVSNIGSAPMTLGDVALTGANPGEFALGTDGCSDAVLDPGEECTVQVSFSPDLVGPRSALLSFPGEIPGSAELSGTGTAPDLSVAPASHDFGNQRIETTSTAKTFTVSNGGTAPLTIGDVAIGGSNPGEFVLGTDSCSDAVLDPGEECTVQVSFSPDLVGPRGALLSFPGEDPGSAELSGTGTAPDFSVAPASFDFGNQRVNTTSTAKAFVVKNTGTASLTLGDVAIGGSNPGEFVLGTDSCSDAVLDPGEECTVQVSFSPDLVGPRGAILSFPGDDPGSAELSGTGIAPDFSVAPTTFDFGNQRIDTTSTAKAFVVKNTGTASLTLGDVALAGSNPGEFVLGTDGCTDAVLDPGEECTVQVSFSPDLVGPRGAILSFPGEDPGSVELTGTGTAPVFSASPTSIDFGSQLVSGGPTAAKTVTVKNNGTASMTISTVSITGAAAAQFGIVAAGSDCAGAVLDPAETCEVEVNFDPTATGPVGATLSFGGQAPGTVELLGTGIAPALSIEPTSLNFGQHLVGTKSGVQPFVVSNSGSAPAQIFSVSLSGADGSSFVLGPTDGCTGVTLAIGATCTVDVSFAPATVGAKSATLDVSGAASVSAPLQGTGIVAKFAATPLSLDFGSREVAAGPSVAQTVTVQNTGTGSMTVESVTPIGAGAAAYAVPAASDKCTGAVLTANQTCTVGVAFDPGSAGAFPATLSFAGNSPGTVPLAGTGIEPRFVATPGGHDFGEEFVGGTSLPVSFSVANAGSAPMPVGAIAISGANPSSFQLIQNGCAGLTLAPGQECGLKVSLTPKAIGPLRAQLDVGANGLELVGGGVEPPPAARLVKSKGPIRVKADGRLKARISCTSMASSCRSGLTLTLRRAPVARWSGSIAPGKTKTVSLRLNKPTRAELFARGKLNLLGLLGSQAGEQRAPFKLIARR